MIFTLNAYEVHGTGSLLMDPRFRYRWSGCHMTEGGKPLDLPLG